MISFLRDIKLLDYQIIVTVIAVAAAWKWGDWKNWSRYYPTMLFFAAGDLLYGLISYNYPLWEFESPLLKTTLSDLLIACAFFPATILIYLPHVPKKFIKQIPYVLSWVMAYSLIEWLSFRLGFFSYHNGWTIWKSVLFNIGMFPLLYVHYEKPLRALVTAFVCALIAIFFLIPISSMK